MNHRTLLNDSEKKLLVAAIKTAEDKTIGEIKIHLDNYCKGDVLDKASNVFNKLCMHETKERTGVLIYIACKDHKIAILGDKGINDKVPNEYWNNLISECIQFFKKEEYYNGLEHTLLEVGRVLHQHFPIHNKNTTNEISNDISFGNDKDE